MSMVIDQQHGFKHFCKICKKGFGCGRALGGHMRAHGLGEDQGHIDEEEGSSDYHGKFVGTPPAAVAVNKRMYARNPNRLKSCRNCENCGKEFSSWKSFLEHGKCSIDLPESDDADGRKGYSWFKGKRSSRAKMVNLNSNSPSSEEEDLANCLMMLSAARVDLLVAKSEESCASDSKEEVSRDLVVVAGNWASSEKAKSVKRGFFECKACKKVFTSHQALGGHRASHKKVKGCFAARLDSDHDESLIEDDVITQEELSLSSKSLVLPLEGATHAPSKRKKVHECSICHRIFASGQALGGHKRCHWITSNSPEQSINAKLHQLEEQGQQLQLLRLKFDKPELLDLNLPAPADELTGIRENNDGQLHLEVSTEMYLKAYLGSNLNGDSMVNVDDEEDGRNKRAKLSDLKEMSLGGGSSSPWLQVGIGSAGNGNNE